MRKYQRPIRPARERKPARPQRELPEELYPGQRFEEQKLAKEMKYARAVARMEKREEKAKRDALRAAMGIRSKTRQEKRLATRKKTDKKSKRLRLEYYALIAHLNTFLPERDRVVIRPLGRIDSVPERAKVRMERRRRLGQC